MHVTQTYLGLVFRATEAVHDNHVMVSPGYLFYGRKASAVVAECIVREQFEPLFAAVELSLRTKRSVVLQRETAK